jgi:hypothetical protein
MGVLQKMKRTGKKLLTLILAAVMCISFLPAFQTPVQAQASNTVFTDVPKDASYYDALNRLTSLGIISRSSDGLFKPNDHLTREQFAKMIVVSAGMEETASALRGYSEFPDIPVNSWSVGYINAAVSKHYITGGLDGKFHPNDGLTYAQICTMLVRALGYTSNIDVPGEWPLNYISKANQLGLTKGMSFAKDDIVPRWAAVVMLNKMLDTEINTASAAGTPTFIDSTGSFNKVIILENPLTDNSLVGNQVWTSRGIYTNTKNISLELGKIYYIETKDGNITRASESTVAVKKLAVTQVTGYRISYIDESGMGASMELPKNVTYYYKGSMIDYGSIPNILVKNSSIVFTYNEDGTAYENGVIYAPIYSDPEVVSNFIPATQKVGELDLRGSSVITKKGKTITVHEIEENDVVYAVTNIWGGGKYIDVYEDKVSGKITAILPNRLSPKVLQIDGVDYSFSDMIDLNDIVYQMGDFTIDDSITVLLGYDGKIVAVQSLERMDGQNYAIVLDAGEVTKSYLYSRDDTVYTATLLFDNNTVSTFEITSDYTRKIGKVVKYKFLDNKTLHLEDLVYSNPYPGMLKVDKEERKVGSAYVADNMRIINIINSDPEEGIQASILRFSDLPSGEIASGKIMNIETAGFFNDISLMITNDLLNEHYKLGILKDDTTNTFLVDGKEYVYTGPPLEESTIMGGYLLEMGQKGIIKVMNNASVDAMGATVQAVDRRRIQVDDKVYFFDNNLSIYLRDKDGEISSINLVDIKKNQPYRSVALYRTRGDGLYHEKISMIVLIEHSDKIVRN